MEMKYIFLIFNNFLVGYDGDRKECFPNKASYLHILLGIFTRSFESSGSLSFCPGLLLRPRRATRVEETSLIGLCCGPFLFPVATFSKPLNIVLSL